MKALLEPFMTSTLREAGDGLLIRIGKAKLMYTKSKNPADAVTNGDIKNQKFFEK